MAATRIGQYWREEHCLPKVEGDTKEAVISELIQCFVKSGALEEQEAPELYGEVMAREEQGTTGIGKGVAMPHASSSQVVAGTLIAVGISQDGIDFEATDGAPVHVIFLIAADDPHEYLSVAGRIARVGRDDIEMRALQRQTTPRKMRTFLEESWGALGD